MRCSAGPPPFRTFAANSPSIWWNGRDILGRERAFVRAIEAGEARPRVLITVGAAEQDPPRRAPPGIGLEYVAKRTAEARMVDNAAELGARLAAAKGAPGYLARYRALDEDDHTTALTTSIGRMLSFALSE